MTATWQIDWMSASTTTINGHSEVVLNCGWRCNGTETVNGKDYATSIYSTCSFPEPAEGGEFTPYASLTQAQVLGWCYSNGVNQAATEAAVQAQLDNLANPPVVQPALPWSA